MAWEWQAAGSVSAAASPSSAAASRDAAAPANGRAPWPLSERSTRNSPSARAFVVAGPAATGRWDGVDSPATPRAFLSCGCCSGAGIVCARLVHQGRIQHVVYHPTLDTDEA